MVVTAASDEEYFVLLVSDSSRLLYDALSEAQHHRNLWDGITTVSSPSSEAFSHMFGAERDYQGRSRRRLDL